MLSVFDTPAPAPCPTPFNLAEHVLRAGQATPDKIALAVVKPTGAQRWSYARLTEAVLGTATGLRARGLSPGDMVLLRLGNTVDFPIAFLGAIAAGLVPVPTSAQLTAPEVDTLLHSLPVAAILQDPAVACPETTLPILPLSEAQSWRKLPPAEIHMGAPDRLAYVVFTSGTSARPRAVAHAHRAIWARQMMFDGWYGLTPEDRLLHAGAFNWTYTLGTGLLDPWTRGATALIPAAGTTPAQLPLLLARNDATLIAAAPGVFRQMLRAPLPRLPKLRHGLSAGEKLPDALRAHWTEATGTPIHEAFGMSECSTFISGAPDAPATAGTLGRPQRGRRVAVLDDTGAPVPRGTPGALAVHRDDPGLMLGYLNDPTETKARTRGDWFLTGDQASMTAQGDVVYGGRLDDILNAGGHRVSPLEVEAALSHIPDLGEVAVTEVTVKADTTVIAAFYTGPEQDSATLESGAAERLARYKQPRLWVRVDSLPRNANGKLLRRALADLVDLAR